MPLKLLKQIIPVLHKLSQRTAKEKTAQLILWGPDNVGNKLNKQWYEEETLQSHHIHEYR